MRELQSCSPIAPWVAESATLSRNVPVTRISAATGDVAYQPAVALASSGVVPLDADPLGCALGLAVAEGLPLACVAGPEPELLAT